MTFYGHVHFSKGGLVGAVQQNEVMREMAESGIIQISDEKLAEYFLEDKDEKHGGLHNYTLHGIRELIRFRRIMRKHVSALVYKEDIQWWTDRKERADDIDEFKYTYLVEAKVIPNGQERRPSSVDQAR